MLSATVRGREQLLGVLRRTFLPRKVIVLVSDDERAAVEKWVPWLSDKEPQQGSATAYVCRGQICDLSTTDPKVFA